MTSEFAPYACDECQSRKIRCSRESLGCSQCSNSSRDCKYSRFGIIRRNRKRKRNPNAAAVEPRQLSDGTNDGVPSPTTVIPENDFDNSNDHNATNLPDAQDIGGDNERNESSLRNNNPLLVGGSAQFWQDTAFIDMAERMRSHGSQLFTFEDEASSWAEMFAEVTEKAKALFTPIPPEVQSKFATHPEQISQKAYLVVFYGIMLTELSSITSVKEETKTKLRWNLWVCLNDARLLLEPSEINIQALMLLIGHVQDFHTPSLCWIITSNACRMLQALGISTHSLDEATRTRRTRWFWVLNGMDKSLALIFGRPPTFPKGMYRSIQKPTVRELADFHPHIPSSSEGASSSLFGAHFLHQMSLLNDILAEMWVCLYDEDAVKGLVTQVRENLDEWYTETRKVLEACFLAEKPLLDDSGRLQLQLGIRHVEFQYYYFKVLLLKGNLDQNNVRQTENRAQEHDDCIHASQRCLHLIGGLVSDSRDVYNGIVWQLLYEPFTAFFALVDHIRMLTHANGHIRSNSQGRSTKSKGRAEEMKASLDAMECLPKFLDEMKTRHPLAEKLWGIANEHLIVARRLVTASGPTASKKQRTARRSVTTQNMPLTSMLPSTPHLSSTSMASPHSIITPHSTATPETQSSSDAPLLMNVDPVSNVSPALEGFDNFDFNLNLGASDWFEWDNITNFNNFNTFGPF